MWHDFGHSYLLSKTQPTPFYASSFPNDSTFSVSSHTISHTELILCNTCNWQGNLSQVPVKDLYCTFILKPGFTRLSSTSSSSFDIGFPTDNVSFHFSTDCIFRYNATSRLSRIWLYPIAGLSFCQVRKLNTVLKANLFVAGAGFEPASFGLWDRAGASPVHPAIFYFFFGGDGRDWTYDPLLNRQALYHWATSPKMVFLYRWKPKT